MAYLVQSAPPIAFPGEHAEPRCKNTDAPAFYSVAAHIRPPQSKSTDTLGTLNDSFPIPYIIISGLYGDNGKRKGNYYLVFRVYGV